MSVFKGYLQLINRNKGIGIIYLLVFIGMTFLSLGAVASNPDTGSFQVTSIDIAVVDMDDSAMSRGLIDYLKVDNKVDITDEIKDELVDLMYYQEISYVVVIPKGYQDKVIDGDVELNVTKGSSITSGVFGDIRVRGFTNKLHVLSEAGFTVDESVEIAKETSSLKADIEIMDIGGNEGEPPLYYYFLRFIPFLYLGVLCFIIGTVMLEFRKDDIRRRIKCGTVSGVKQGLSGLLAFGLLAVLIYAITAFVAVVYFGKDILGDTNLSLYMINALVLLTTALSISYLLGVSVRNESALSGLANIVSLGLCFLGGVFVPLEMLGGVVIKIARFLPTYWYENNLDVLIGHPELLTVKGEALESYFLGIGVQFAMSTVIIVVALVVRSAQNKAE